ncbi:hypothetical protein WDU94_012358 [Cyamophila willieti]
MRHTASKLNRTKLGPKLSCSQRKKIKRDLKIAAGTWTEQKPRKEVRAQKGVKATETSNRNVKTGDQTPQTSMAGKRKRSVIETPPKDAVNKKTKPSYSEVLAKKLAIYPANYPDTKLTEEDSFNLQRKMLEFFNPIENPGIQFHSCRIESGVFTVTCANQATQEWLVDCVRKIGKWKEVTLECKPASKVLNTTKIITRIPPVMKEDPMDLILQRIDSQNIDIGVRTEDWRILNIKSEPSGGKTVVLTVTDEELKKLKERRFTLFLGFEKIQFSVLDKKPPATECPEDTQSTPGQHSA